MTHALEPVAPERRAWILAAAAVGAFVSTVMATAVNVALPSLVTAFDAPFALVQWVVLAYLLVTAALLPIVGRLADMWGKRAIFVGGFVVFGLGSLATGLAPGIEALIVFRAVHGLGSAVLTGVGLAIVTDVYPEEHRGRAIGINGAVLATGIVMGPALGGALVELDWRLVFLAGVPVAACGGWLAWKFVPRYARGTKQRFDLPGAALLVAALTSLSLALTLGQGRGFGDPWIVTSFALAAALAPLFLLRQARTDHPVVDLSLFREARLSIGLAAGLGTFVSIAGTIFVMPFYLELVQGRTPGEVGLLMAVTPMLLVIVSPIAGALADRYGERIVTVVGLGFALVGFTAVGTLSESTTALGFVLRFVPVGIGMATFQSPNNSAIMGAVPPGRSGVAGGLLGLTRALGQTVGIAVLGSLWAARVALHAAADGADGAAVASASAQVAGLHDMMRVVQALIIASLILCVWDLRRRHAPPRYDRQRTIIRS
ncbi:MAG: MFS transporter [Trueperaceae bacterium]